MSKEDPYVTVRIPRYYDRLINQYIERHREEMQLQGQRTSRSGVVRRALLAFFTAEGLIKGDE